MPQPLLHELLQVEVQVAVQALQALEQTNLHSRAQVILHLIVQEVLHVCAQPFAQLSEQLL